MKITKLYIHNFLTIGTANLELDDRGLLLVQGKNEDDTSASSNGAGKSSIVDALCWCLYGETARGESGDAVVNDKVKKDCRVIVMIEDAGQVYKIERYRKHTTEKNVLRAYHLPGGLSGASTDLSKGTDKETQEVVTKIVGCSIDVFKGAVYAGQEAMPDLPGMTDKNLKLLIEEAAGTEELAEAYTEARTQYASRDAELKAVQGAETSAKMAVTDSGNKLVAAREQHKLFEDGRKDRARAELAKIVPVEKEIATTKAELAGADKAKIEARIGEIDTHLAGHKALQDAQAKLNVAVMKTNGALTTAMAAVNGAKRVVDARERDIANINAKVGTPCGECGKAYCEHDMEAAKKTQETLLRADKEILLAAAQAAKTHKKEHEDAVAAAEAHKATIPDVSALNAERRDLQSKLDAIGIAERTIARMEGDVTNLKAQAKKKLTEPNPHEAVVKAREADLDAAEKQLAAIEIKRLAAEETLALYADAVKVFGPAGVRAHILDLVTPYLNERTADYLGALSDGNIVATWSTLAKSAKGDLKEKFNIDVANDKGGKSFGLLSGGEKRKVRIAANLALQDMVASRAEKPIGLWIGDEIDHALDEPGLERLMGVLEKKAKERGTVLVISHNALGDWIDNQIVVTKSGGVSTVSGATERGF